LRAGLLSCDPAFPLVSFDGAFEMTKFFEDCLRLEKSEVHVTFKVTVENDIRNMPEGVVELETYGPLFRDDLDDSVASLIDDLITKQLLESGRMDQIVSEMIDEMIYV